MIIFTIDAETTVNGGIDGSSPEAHYPANRILWWGHKKDNEAVKTDSTCNRFVEDLCNARALNDEVLIVGHNLKFDLKYLLRDYPQVLWSRFHYYCTMHHEYIQSGHRHKFMSLEDACATRGIPFKKGLDLGAMLDAGLKMEDIPDSDLVPYLIDDVEATYQLFKKQSGVKRGLSNLTLPLAAMELNGLLLDVPKTQKAMRKLAAEEEDLLRTLTITTLGHLQWDDGEPVKFEDVKITAPRTISYLLTGAPRGGFVKGKRAIKFRQTATPMLTANEIGRLWGKTVPSNLGYPMPAAKLEDVAKVLSNSGYVVDLLAYRKVSKVIGTYYGPMLAEAAIQDTVHPKLHMVSTNTGRLSSANPNGQNMPPEVRNCYKSKYGFLREIDFKQLEVVALAAVSMDKRLIQDINDGEDIHFNTGRRVMGWKTPADMTEVERTLVKNVNFGLIYGGGAAGLSMQTGQPKKLVQSLIDAFYSRYPGVAEWQNKFYKEVVASLKPSHIEKGEQVYSSMVTLPISQRRFYFEEKLSPPWLHKTTGRKFSFKPTETKNYPIQGFAGGDIVMAAACLLYQRLEKLPEAILRMTVHDSILVDTSGGDKWLQREMDKVCQEIVKMFNLPTPLVTDIKSGKCWQ